MGETNLFILKNMSNSLNFQQKMFSIIMCSICASVTAMVHQQYEPCRDMADWSYGPSATRLSTEDTHKDCQSKNNASKCNWIIFHIWHLHLWGKKADASYCCIIPIMLYIYIYI